MNDTDQVNTDAVDFEEADEDRLEASAEREKLSEAVVSASDWTTETLLAQLDRQNIQLNPRFQRRDAWTTPRKSRFIESLILGLPVPQIVLAERKGERGKYVVLDGKQRLLSLLQFVGGGSGKHNSYPLAGLEVLKDLEGVGYEQLSKSPNWSGEYTAFLNQTVRAVVIKNWPDVEFLHLVFLRLNTGSVRLSSQELRQAMFPGPFADFVDETAMTSPTLQRVLRLQEPDFRMRDVEVLVRYFSFQNFLPEYRGELKLFLDYACEQLNRTWKAKESVIKEQAGQFEAAGIALTDIFGVDQVGRRPENGAGRRPFNRAIFDVQVYYLADERIRSLALKKKSRVQQAFLELWKKDPDFVRAVESTTKTIEATHKRYAAWGAALAKAIGTNIRVPSLKASRIKP